MIRPKSVKIFGKTYKVENAKEKITHPEIEGETEGLYTPYPKTITIWGELEKDDYLDCLIHEVIHVIDSELGLGFKEKQIKALGVGLADFFITNGIIKL